MSFDPGTPSWFNMIFPAEITAISGTSYTFAEQILDSSGDYTAVDCGRTGTATEINGNVVAVPQIVWMRFAGMIDGDATYEFDADSIGVEHNGTLVGTEPNINFIDDGSISLTVADNPTENRVDVTIINTCCPLTLACCPQIWFPNTIYATITDTGGQCSCYAGSFALTWNSNGFPNAWSAVVPIIYAPGDCPGPSDEGPAQFVIILTPCYSGGNNWQLQMYCGLYDLFQLIVSGVTEPTCYPLSATFSDLSNTGGTWGTCCVNVDILTVVITA